MCTLLHYYYSCDFITIRFINTKYMYMLLSNIERVFRIDNLKLRVR